MFILRGMRRGRGVFAAVRSWMPLMLEIAITVASARMCLLLSINQNYFDKYHTFFFWLLEHFPNQEWKWAILAGSAAALKAVGMVLMPFRMSEKAIETAFVLRGTGWALSVVLWTTFGLSIQIGDAWSLGAICCGVMAPLSLAALVMGPAMPEAGHGYEG